MRRALLAVVVLVACRRQPTPSAEPVLSTVAELSGCDAVAAPGVCEVDDQELRIAVASATAPTVKVDAADVTPRVKTIGSGVLLTIDVKRTARQLTIGDATFVLAETTRSPWLREANTLRRAGKLAEALAIAEAHRNDRGADGARAKGLLARIALAKGQTDDAVAHFRASIAEHSASGRISEETDDRFAAAWALSQVLLRFEDARKLLDEGRAHIESYADGRARLGYYRALIALKSGDTRGALGSLAVVRRETERLGLSSDWRDAEETTANTLFSIGRAAEARTRLAALDESGEADPPCRRADRLVNLALAQQALGALDDARAAIGKGLELARKGCPGGWREANLLLDLSRIELQRGQREAAHKALAESRAVQGSALNWLVAAQGHVEGQLLLLAGKPRQALDVFTSEEALASASFIIEAMIRARVGRAEALVALGRDDDARAAYEAAEDLLDDAVLLVPLGEGRAMYAESHDRGTKGLVELLVRRGRAAEALAAVRRARARAFVGLVAGDEIRSLDPIKRARFDAAVAAYRRARSELESAAAKDWSLPPKELGAVRASRAVREKEVRDALEAAIAVLRARRGTLPKLAVEQGTAVVAWYPAKSGYHAFVATGDGVHVRSVDRPSAEGLPAVPRIRVLPGDALELHTMTDAVVEYSLDLPVAAASEGGVVVASDPSGNLPSAREEGDLVERALREQWKLPVTRLHQNGVRRDALLAALGRARLFHFAGHAIASELALDSALVLADGSRLTVGDVLSLARVPEGVVLSACEAAHAAAASDGLGLAQAFVIAGARSAIAPTRPVRDALARKIAEELYADVAAEVADLPAALHRAVARVRATEPSADVAAFRAIVR